jgi:hypothetical protein
MVIKILNVLAIIIGLLLSILTIFAQGSDIDVVSIISVILLVLLCVMSVYFSNTLQRHKLFFSAVPLFIVIVVTVVVFLNPYVLMTNFFSTPGIVIEEGFTNLLAYKDAYSTGDKYNEDIKRFKEKFPPVYTCSSKLSGMVESFIVKNESKNAFILIDFSRTDFWATPLGKIQGDTLYSYHDINSTEFRDRKLKTCYDSFGTSILDTYHVISDPNTEGGYADYDINMYDMFHTN